MAKQALEQSGGWEEVRGELVSLFEDANEADDGTMLVEAEYLQAIVELPS